MPNPILTVSNLSKSFSGVRALHNVQLALHPGEVHALLGENGAGKSTFMKILIGLLTPDSGEIWFDGEPLRANNVHDVLKRGISMIHQELLTVPELTVAQNIFLGREPKRWGFVDEAKLNSQAETLLQQLGVDLRPDARMKHLSVAQMQLVDIAKALSNDAKVIIMDEPTSALSDTEVQTLFGIIRDLQRKGVAIIYISHKLDEIFALCNTITVLRDGQLIDSRPATDYTPQTLIAQLVGRTLESLFPEPNISTGREVLRVEKLGQPNKFEGISFSVHAGEVVGLGGLMGAGRSEVVQALFGMEPHKQGRIYINGQPVQIHTPQDAIRHGIGFVGEDRKQTGFIPALSVRENITLICLPNFTKRGLVHEPNETVAANRTARDLNIKTAGLGQRVMHLSGGNQQKVVLGKVLLSKPSLVILDEPTRGIDVGAKAEIYKLINQLTSNGIAVLLISSELPELLGLSHRIVVLAKGKQTAVLLREEATPQTVMQYAMA
ncbi:MAG: sugar ABC transporter ATP-binding protein [Cytophagales bacterium]|nr:MAG: sugar ABC transporter ATP-binding protein [Cytophagales bacterium]